VEKKVSRDDEISLSGDQWKRLGNIAELATFFQVVEAAERGQSGPPALTPLPLPPGYPGTGAYPLGHPPSYPPPAGYPVASPIPLQPGVPPPAPGPSQVDGGAPSGAAWESQPPAAPRAAGPEPAWAAAGRKALPDTELDAEDLKAVKGGGGRVAILLFLLALVGGGAAVWYLEPEWLAPLGLREPPPPTSPPPVALAAPPAKPEPPPPAPAPEPPKADTPPPAEKAPEMVKEPVMVKEAPKPQARGVKQLLAEAERLRERGKVEKALDLYGRIVDLYPDNPAAMAGRGWCYLDLSQYAPAEASFQAALAGNPTYADALMGLAEAYRYEGRREQAIGYYQKYLAAHPNGEDAVAARNALSQLKE
jgi:TolA-binding protein